MKSIENRLHLKRRLYHLHLKRGISISYHTYIYIKFLANLVNVNVNVVIEDEEKALILLSSLPNKGYDTFVLSLINGKISFSYSEVTTALANLELRRKARGSSFSDIPAEILAARESNPDQRGNQHRSNSKSMFENRQLKKNQYAFCKEK